MEEQKKAMNVNMSNKSKVDEKSKLTYDQLKDACNQLWQQNQQLIKRSRELEQFAINKRLDYLFKVIEFSSMFSSDFVVNCTSEIEQAMTIPQEEDKKEE